MVLGSGACAPDSTPGSEAAATTESVELEELEQAVAEAADTLLDAPAVETGLVARTPDGEVDMLRWAVRVDEDTFKFVRVRRTDGGTMAGSDATVPPGREVAARVVIDDGSAGAGRSPMDDRPRPWAHDFPVGSPVWPEGADNPVQLAAGEVLDPSTIEDHDIDASVRRAGDGTATWTATWQGEDRTTTYSWAVASAGHLAEHRREFSASPDRTFAERARFEPRQDAPTITLPPEGAQLDLDRFGVWPDLPRPTAEAS